MHGAVADQPVTRLILEAVMPTVFGLGYRGWLACVKWDALIEEEVIQARKSAPEGKA